MEQSTGFLFEIFKIGLQSLIYGLVIFLLIKYTLKRNLSKMVWLVNSLLVMVSMYTYLNTHWGNHGIGDSQRIPLEHYREVDQMNGTDAYITINEYSHIPIKEFTIKGNLVIGKTGEDAIRKYPEFFVWNFKYDNISYCDSKFELDSITQLKKYDLQPFNVHYKNYWGGWKFWLLP